MRLYPKVVVKGQSFTGVKNVVIPDQSLTLGEIIKRFIKRQALPMTNDDAHYNDSHDDIDLEKLEHMDNTEKADVLEEVKQRVKRMQTVINERKIAEQQKDPKEESSPPKA